MYAAENYLLCFFRRQLLYLLFIPPDNRRAFKQPPSGHRPSKIIVAAFLKIDKLALRINDDRRNTARKKLIGLFAHVTCRQMANYIKP
jgi:hypothetical protein